VEKNIFTKDLNCFQDISVEKVFEMSVTELVDYGSIIVCMSTYISPVINLQIFFKNLELIIQKIQSRNKKFLLCGDWNLNFMVDNRRLQELQNILESYDMINMVRFLTKITFTTESVIDVIITKR
jgi:hypothetical protein